MKICLTQQWCFARPRPFTRTPAIALALRTSRLREIERPRGKCYRKDKILHLDDDYRYSKALTATQHSPQLKAFDTS